MGLLTQSSLVAPNVDGHVVTGEAVTGHFTTVDGGRGEHRVRSTFPELSGDRK
jgi:hypothetical protein